MKILTIINTLDKIFFFVKLGFYVKKDSIDSLSGFPTAQCNGKREDFRV